MRFEVSMWNELHMVLAIGMKLDSWYYMGVIVGASLGDDIETSTGWFDEFE